MKINDICNSQTNPKQCGNNASNEMIIQINNHHYLSLLICCCRTRRFNEAVRFWKEYRSNLDNTPHSSSTYELLLYIYHTPQTVEAVRQDMIRLGVVMNEKCGLAYVNSLLKNQKIDEVMKFTENEFALRVR